MVGAGAANEAAGKGETPSLFRARTIAGRRDGEEGGPVRDGRGFSLENRLQSVCVNLGGRSFNVSRSTISRLTA
jgi:hypothetical protein